MKHLMLLIHGGEGRNRGIYRSREGKVSTWAHSEKLNQLFQNNIKYEYRSKLVLKKKQ